MQAAAVPGILSGEDLIVGAETGSGKTLAYLLPIVERQLRGHAVAKDLPNELLGKSVLQTQNLRYACCRSGGTLSQVGLRVDGEQFCRVNGAIRASLYGVFPTSPSAGARRIQRQVHASVLSKAQGGAKVHPLLVLCRLFCGRSRGVLVEERSCW